MVHRLVLVLTPILFGGGRLIPFDELHCESAMALLASCCPHFDPSARLCSSSPSSCTSTSGVFPDLSLAESDCILALGCEEIIKRGLCTSVAELPTNYYDECPVKITSGATGCGFNVGDPSCPSQPTLYVIHPPVCP